MKQKILNNINNNYHKTFWEVFNEISLDSGNEKWVEMFVPQAKERTSRVVYIDRKGQMQIVLYEPREG